MSSSPPVPRKLKHHVFVCLNERPPGHARGSCKASGAEEILDRFKQAVKDAGLKSEVRAQKAGCLDTCEWGPSVVVYPEGVWYARVRLEDVEEIVQSHLKEGRPVQRLLMPGK